MKKIIGIAALLTLSACGPKPMFKVGDCITNESRSALMQVEAVGENFYLVDYSSIGSPRAFIKYGMKTFDRETSRALELGFEKVRCHTLRIDFLD